MEPILASHFDYVTHNPRFHGDRRHPTLEVRDDGAQVQVPSASSGPTSSLTTKAASPGDALGWRTACARDALVEGRTYWCFEVVNRGPDAGIMLGVSSGNGNLHGIGCPVGEEPEGCEGAAAVHLGEQKRYFGERAEPCVPLRRPASLIRNARYIGLLLDLEDRVLLAFSDGVCLGAIAGSDVLSRSAAWYPMVSFFGGAAKTVRCAALAPRVAGAFTRAARIPRMVLDSGVPVTVHSIQFDDNRKSKPLLLTRGGAAVQPAANLNESNFTALATESFDNGRHYFSFAVACVGDKGHATMGITDGSVDLNQPTEFPGLCTGAALHPGGSGPVRGGKRIKTQWANTFATAKHIGFLVDMVRRTLTLFADEAVAMTVLDFDGTHMMRADRYWPAVSLCDMGQVIIPDVLSPPTDRRPPPMRTDTGPLAFPLPPLVQIRPGVQLLRPRFDVTHVSGEGLTLADSNFTVNHTIDHAAWRVAFAEEALPPAGKSFFSALVFARGREGNIHIGIAEQGVDRAPFRGAVLTPCYPGDAACPGASVSIGTGMRYCGGQSYEVSQLELLTKAVRIGVLTDMAARTVTFFADGQMVGFGAGPEVLSGHGYYPCVAVKDAGSSVMFESTVA